LTASASCRKPGASIRSARRRLYKPASPLYKFSIELYADFKWRQMLLQKGQVIAQPCSLHTTSGKTPLTPEKPGEIEINPESEFQAASSNKKNDLAAAIRKMKPFKNKKRTDMLLQILIKK
jgi:hypothetical protein